MKNKLLMFIAILLSFSSISPVKATDFEGKEDEYTEKCKQTDSLSQSDIQVCKEYSDYLKEKNQHIEQEINSTQNALNQTLESIEDTKVQLAKTEEMVISVQNEITVLEAAIQQTTEEIERRETQVANRMYFLQSYVNGNEYLYLLFSSDSLDQLLTRIQNIDELTSYDKDLITGLATAKLELEQDKADAALRYNDLFALQTQQMTLLSALGTEAANYTTSLQQIQDTLSGNRVDIGFIDESLSEAQRRLQAEEDRKRAEEEAKREQEQQNNTTTTPPPGQNENTPNNEDISTTPDTSISSNIGQAIALTAQTKIGAPYVYGGIGPNVFDCSGFAQWVYKQHGIYIPRVVTSQYYACELVSNPQPGDLLFFNTTGFLGHVGIYIGGDLFVHAGTSATGVCYGNLSLPYWQNCYQGAGRYR